MEGPELLVLPILVKKKKTEKLTLLKRHHMAKRAMTSLRSSAILVGFWPLQDISQSDNDALSSFLHAIQQERLIFLFSFLDLRRKSVSSVLFTEFLC